ncbi:MAG: SDR family NAD(P)-dependent oxidoreductase, partial [Pseudomonadota bacterium]
MPTTSTPLIRNWTPEAIPDLSGKRYLITGGNSGIGLEAAKLLAARNADVVLACRSTERGRAALDRIADLGFGTSDLITLDLASMASIRAAAARAKEQFGTFIALINNAGVMQTPKVKTKDGFEMQLGVNHLGHFLWTALMIGRVDPEEGRVVTVSSIAHKFA